MQSLVKAQHPGKLYSPDDASLVHASLDVFAFVSVFNGSKGMCIGGLADTEAKALTQLMATVKAWLNAAQSSLGDCDVKLIGRSQQVAALKAAFHGARMTEKVIEAGSAELYFYPESNRVRLAMGGPALALVTSNVVKVAICDDSKTIRTLLRNILSTDSSVEIVGEANGATELLSLLKTTRPDVITLDIHMPEMDGVQLLKTYIPAHPIPTVVITSLSKEEGPMVFEALSAGAVDYVQKPSMSDMAQVAREILEKVKNASKAKVVGRVVSAKVPTLMANGPLRQDVVVAIGSSTGGTDALQQVLTQLPANIPPIVIVQHIPPVFSLAFAKRLNDICPFEVKEAVDDDEVRPGRVLIAPGGCQMHVVRKQGALRVVIHDGPPVNRHKPSVDVLFDSIAKEVGKKAIGVILTGMGNDGAKGLLAIKETGAPTMAQDEASCVVYGMPKEAVKLGAALEVLPLSQIPVALVRLLTVGGAARVNERLSR